MTRRGKRDRPTELPPVSALSKRLRPALPPSEEAEADPISAAPAAEVPRGSSTTSTVVVSGLPPGCSVLELKSRLEMYGPISRTRVDTAGRSAHVTFRSPRSADAALSASLDPAAGIDIRSHPVEVCRASDPVPQWRIAVGVSSSSRLLRAELPLSRHGRSHKKLNADKASTINGSELPHKGREMVAYDDLF